MTDSGAERGSAGTEVRRLRPDDLAAWKPLWQAYTSFYVDPAARGGSVARELFAAIYAEARRRGADRVYWHAQQFNGPARSLYDTVGRLTSFVVYEEELARA